MSLSQWGNASASVPGAHAAREVPASRRDSHRPMAMDRHASSNPIADARATSARCGGCPACQRACRCDATTESCRSWHPGFRTHNTGRHDRCDLSFRRLRRPRAASRHVVPKRSFDQTRRGIAASAPPALSALDTLCYRRSAGTGNRERMCASHRRRWTQTVWQIASRSRQHPADPSSTAARWSRRCTAAA